jgi:sulfite exporter TauE/SafE
VNLFLPMFGVGLVTSVHCVAMCGSMVLSYAVKGDSEGPLLKRMLPHFAYHSAKLTSYVAVGLLLGAIGSAFNLGGVRGWVTVAAGAFMILLGLQMTGKVPALRNLALKPPRFLLTALQKTRRKANDDAAEGKASLATPVVFGLLTGLMPCGPLQGAQLAAAATGSPVSGAIAMLGFGLGTMPLMLGFGAVSGMLGAKFKKRMMVAAAVLVMGLGLVMLDRGAMLVGSPVTSQSIRQAVLGSQKPQTSTDAGYTTGADGVVEVPLVIADVQFQPSALSIPADKPVRLVVDRREDNACSAQLAVPQLGILANLRPNGITVVDLPASKAGNYTLTCGMGMMAGTLSVGGGAASSASGAAPLASPLTLVLLAVLTVGAGGWWVTRRRTAAVAPAPTVPASGHSKGKTGRAHKGAPAPTPAQARTAVLGMEPAELMLAASAVVMAIVVGLGLGGYFS